MSHDSCAAVEEQWERGYLDLEFHSGQRAVRRRGKTVDFSGRRLNWAILQRLEKSRENWLHLDGLKRAWEDAGRSDAPERGTVDDALTTLRRHLRPLGVTIVNSRMDGWRLALTEKASFSRRRQQSRKRPNRKRP